jgi:hypothetical protein
MTNDTLIHARPDPVAWLYVTAIIVLAALIGKEVIGWLLMKLYEIFIQQNPVNL